MIYTTLDPKDLARIEKALKDAPNDSRKILKKAINDTAKKATAMIAKEARASYATKETAGKLKSAMKIEKATVGDMEATIKAKGGAKELIDYKVSPGRAANAVNPPKIYKARVLKSSSLKRLQSGGIKAFVVQFGSGHVSVAQRTGKGRLPLKLLYSPSVPGMLGGEHGYKKVEPEVGEMLHSFAMAELEKALAKN